MSPTHQQFNVGVKALITKEGCVLALQKRERGLWELPGGRINRGERLIDTLQRELGEELPGSVRARIGGVLHAQQGEFPLSDTTLLMLLFFRVHIQLPAKLQLSEEHLAAKWLTPADLQQLPMTSADRAAVQTYFSFSGYDAA